MELKDRLAYIMEKRGIASAAELSRMTGLTQVAIRNYMRGIKFPSAQALRKLARALSTTTDYLLSGTPYRSNRIPIFFRIPGGDPAAWTDGDYPAGFGDEYIDRGDITDDNAFALIVEGDSMSPRINSGDIVIISPNTPVENRGIGAVSLDGGERTLKRIIYLDNDSVLLQPENQNHAPMVCPKNRVSIIGKVIERRERL